MKKILFLIALATTSVLTGCINANGSHVVTGTVHPAISADGVKIYSTPPAQYENVGMVSAVCNGSGQKTTDKVLAELKNQAAQIGANGILTGSQQQNSVPTPIYTQYGVIMVNGNTVSLSGTAIFVP